MNKAKLILSKYHKLEVLEHSAKGFKYGFLPVKGDIQYVVERYKTRKEALDRAEEWIVYYPNTPGYVFKLRRDGKVFNPTFIDVRSK